MPHFQKVHEVDDDGDVVPRRDSQDTFLHGQDFVQTYANIV